MNFKGLGALLFDDGVSPRVSRSSSHLTRYFAEPPPTVLREEDVIKKTLGAIGVTYSHMNDDILVPSRIEAARTKKTLQVRRTSHVYDARARVAGVRLTRCPRRRRCASARVLLRQARRPRGRARSRALRRRLCGPRSGGTTR